MAKQTEGAMTTKPQDKLDEAKSAIQDLFGSQCGMCFYDNPCPTCAEFAERLEEIIQMARKSTPEPSATNARELAERAAHKIAVNTDEVSAALKGPRFLFEEYIKEVADIIEKEFFGALLESSSLQPKWERLEACPECDGDGCNHCESSSLQPQPWEQERDAIMEALHITFDEETGYEAVAESEPQYFETLAEAIKFEFELQPSVPQQVTPGLISGKWGYGPCPHSRIDYSCVRCLQSHAERMEMQLCAVPQQVTAEMVRKALIHADSPETGEWRQVIAASINAQLAAQVTKEKP